MIPMRNLVKLFATILVAMFLTSNVRAQSSTRPWLLGAGINAIDLHGVDSTSDILKTEFWNSVPAISHLELARSLNPSFAVDLQLSGSRITTNRFGETVGGKGFFAGDIDLRYKFDNGYIFKE